jgi:hypothetical protein
MKKHLQSIVKTALVAFLILPASVAFGQIIITSVPDSIAVLNDAYTYDVNATYTGNAPTYSLLTYPSGMTINPTTGVISWTPTAITQGSQVSVRAQNSSWTATQTYYLFISDAIECDPAIISYWPMDAKVGSSIPDFAGGYEGLWQGAPGPEPSVNANGQIGSCVKFDPTNYLDWGYNVVDENQYEFKNTMEFSVSFWFKNQPASITPNLYRKEDIIARWAGAAFNNAVWEIKWNPSTELIEFHMRDNGPTDTVLVSSDSYPISDNDTWHHVVAAFWPDPPNDSYMHLWVDNRHTWLKYDFWRDDFSGTEPLTIGYNPNDVIPFSGYLDDLAIWNKELLQSDVTALYNKGLSHQPLCAEGDVAPIILSSPVTTGTEDVSYSYTLTYRSMGNAPVTLSAPVKPSWLNFNTSTGQLSGTPLNANSGNHNVTLRVTSGSTYIEQSFVINVAAVNDAPQFTSTQVTSAVSLTQYSYLISATDEEGQTLTMTCPTKPGWLGFTSSGGSGVLMGTPARSDVGTADVSLRVTDGTNNTYQNFTITVEIDNHVPVITSTAVTDATVDVLYTYTLVATDADGDALTYTAPVLPAWLNFNSSTRVLSGIPAQDDLGSHDVTLEVSDGTDPATQEFTIEVIANGIENSEQKFGRVYPVPVHDKLNFEFNETMKNAMIQIFNTAGELMKSADVSGFSSYPMDVTDLKPNTYLFRISTPKGHQTGTIIVR